jgi:phosphonate transport system permease protein
LRWDALFASAETEGSIAFWFYRLPEWALLILEKANMAALATLTGSVLSLLLTFPAARNIAPSGAVYQITQRFLEALRTIPEIVYALIFVWAFGVGALAGILAIALHSAGANGKAPGRRCHRRGWRAVAWHSLRAFASSGAGDAGPGALFL